MTPREELELFRKVERLEEAMMQGGLLPRPVVPEKIVPERISCPSASPAQSFPNPANFGARQINSRLASFGLATVAGIMTSQ